MPCPFRLQRLQPVARELPRVGEAGGGVQDFEALPGLTIEALNLADKFAIGEGLCPFVPVAHDHGDQCSGVFMIYVKRQYVTPLIQPH